MSERIAMSLPGNNVLTDTNPNDYIFHSDYNTFKILYQGTASISVTTGTNLYTVAHNAPTVPPLLAVFGKFPDGYTTPLSFSLGLQHDTAYLNAAGKAINNTWWDNTNINFYVAGAGTNYTVNIAWYAFEPQI